MPFRRPRAGELKAAMPRVRVPVRLRLPTGRPSPFIAALLALAAAVSFVAAITYFGARVFTGRAADDRASGEAQSFARTSGTTATGEAYAGYIEILRYADDPLVRTQATPPDARAGAMQQLLYLNTNRMDALAVVDRSGLILARTDDSIEDVRGSEAFQRTRANLGPANSDIVLADGADPYVEYTAPLRDPGGTIWAFLYARTDPRKLWSATLAGTVDGSRNVIINAEGRYSAGVSADLIGRPWSGVPLKNGSVRARIDGESAVCGLGAIGRDTQIDHGWNVASCLPASVVHAEARDAMGQQLLVTIAAAVLAIVLAGGMLRVLLAPPPAASASAPDGEPPEAEPAVAPPFDTPAASAPPDGTEAASEPAPAMPALPAIVIQADVDALAIINAYERRNAALADRLRESVQARLMLVMARSDEAFRLATSGDEEAAAEAASLHARAVEEMEQVRERDLRAIGHDLHPGVVRLGLPAALRALRKDIADAIALELDIDPAVDRVETGASIDAPRRMLIYRIVRDAADACSAADATSARVALRRDADLLDIRIDAAHPTAFDPAALAAHALAVQAYGGTLTIDGRDGGTSIAATIAAPISISEAAEPSSDAALSEPDPDSSGAMAAIIDRARDGVSALRVDVTLEEAAGRVIPSPACAALLAALIRDAGDAFVAAGATEAALAVQPAGAEVGVTLRGETEAELAESAVAAINDAIEAAGGFVAVARRGRIVTVNAEIPLADAAPQGAAAPAEAPVVVVPAPPDARSFASTLREAVDALETAVAVELDIDDESLAAAPAMPLGLDTTLIRLVGDAAAALSAAGATSCAVAIRYNAPATFVVVTASAGGPVDAAMLAPHREAVEAAGACFAVTQRDATFTLTVEIPAGLESPPAVIRLAPRPDAA